MHDKDLYKKFLGIDNPWFISQVTVDDATLTIEVLVEFRGEPCCPRCRKACAGYDSRRRKWRHLDSCQYKTLLVADLPRVQCAEAVELEETAAHQRRRSPMSHNVASICISAPRCYN